MRTLSKEEELCLLAPLTEIHNQDTIDILVERGLMKFHSIDAESGGECFSITDKGLFTLKLLAQIRSL